MVEEFGDFSSFEDVKQRMFGEERWFLSDAEKFMVEYYLEQGRQNFHNATENALEKMAERIEELEERIEELEG